MIGVLSMLNVSAKYENESIIEYVIYGINAGYQCIVICLNYGFSKYCQRGGSEQDSKILIKAEMKIFIRWSYIYCIAHLRYCYSDRINCI